MTPDISSQELSPVKRALLEIRDLRGRLAAMEQAQAEPIAITGMGLRFPGDVKDAQSFWQLLQDGVDAITEIPPERWSLEEFYDPDASKPGKMTTRYGGFLKDVDRFDAAFFGISPREAISMDPQQRLLLETAWEALENAGQSPEKLLGSLTGVFVGIANSDYFRIVVSDPQKIDTYASTGGTFSVAAGRIAYLLGLNGPAISVDTACSSSLVAIHQACNSLRLKECHLALAGGVNLTLTPEANINFSKAGMMALDGRCKTFDALADGYVRGEGCAMIVLKRLSDALKDGDHILAVVRGSALNQDGRSSGLTAPNGLAQEAVIRAALNAAGVEPYQVSFIEAHGTATSLGDPIEVRALGTVYSQGRDFSQPLPIGSVKTNFGHLEAAAGIAGLLKVVLALQHGEIPPNLHFQTPNPHIPWADFPVMVPTTRLPWQPIEGRRIAGVSSFGFSGTNSHVILEEAPAQPIPKENGETVEWMDEGSNHPRLFTLSAKSPAALKELAKRYEEFLGTRSFTASEYTSLTRTASVGRSHYTQRLAVSAVDAAQLRERLGAFREEKASFNWWQGQQQGSDQPSVVFLFTGHGTHYVNMGRQLYETEPVVRQVMDHCDELLRPRLPQPLLSVLYPAANPSQTGDSLQVTPGIDDMTYGQPAMFALEFGLASLWRSWGIEPVAVAGHSLGEYVAAAVAGVLSMEDSLTLIAERGRLMQQLPEDGEMVTVFAEEQRVAPLLAPYAAEVSIAAVNSPETLVISGRRAAVLELVETLKAQKIRCRRLNISRAAHSPMVEPMMPAIAHTSAGMQFSTPQIEFFSSVYGKSVSEDLTHPEYWQRHLRSTVRFAATAHALYQAGYRTFLEIGPNPTLISLGQRSVPEDEPTVWLPSLREGWADWDQMYESLAQLYVNGASVDWAAFHGKGSQPSFSLPTYPWERKSYWWKSEHHADLSDQAAELQPAQLWEKVVAVGSRQSQLVPLDLEISTFPQKWETLNRLAAATIANTLHSLGAFNQPSECHTQDTLIKKCSILPTYRALMSRWLMQLADSGWLQRNEDGSFTSVQALQPQPLDAQRTAVQLALADAPFVIDYVFNCCDRLTSVITGKESPLELMFPGGSMQRAEDLYQKWAHARYYSHIIGAVIEAISNVNPNKELRLLEIGAGTGATTSAVLPVLPASRSVYYYTDISTLFLDHAREKFAGYPFVHYSLFDVEKDGLEQGYGRGQYEVVIAANVIHATRSLSETLQNVCSLLAPNGILILFEATNHQPWYDITTGLIEGWQSFSDALRADSPLLSAVQWEGILREAGFNDVAVLPPAGSPADILGECVIVALTQPQGEIDAAEIIERDGVSQAIGGNLPESSTPADDLLRRLEESLPDERKEIMLEFVRSHVVRVLHLDPETPPERKARLMDLGVDSLMAVELRGRLTTNLKLSRKLPATLIFDYPTIEAITDYLLREVLVFDHVEISALPTADEPAETPSTLTPVSAIDIESLSDEEVEAMLLKKLRKLD